LSGSAFTFKPFFGIEDATFDDKSRLLVSKKKRDRLGPDFVITLGALGCLEMYSKARFDERISDIYAGGTINPSRDDFVRLQFNIAEDELNFDAQGRVVIPSRIRKAAELPDKVIVAGCGDHCEIWDPARYERYQTEAEAFEHEAKDKYMRAAIRMSGRI